MNYHTKCQKRQEAIGALVLGLLDPAAETELRRHLDICDLCRGVRDAMVEEENAVRSAFDVIARSAKAASSALAERFGKADKTPSMATQPAKPGRRIVAKGWRIMKTHYRITSLAASLVLLASVAAVLLWPTYPGSYVLGQTVDAIKNARFVHTLMRDSQGRLIDERWIEIGADGNQARYYQDANAPQYKTSLLIIDDGKVCYALDRVEGEVMLKPTGSYQWIYNLADFFESLTKDGTVTVEQNARYRGKPAHKVRWVKGQIDCYIDLKTRLPLTVGPMELEFTNPPAGVFTVPKPPAGVKVVDLRGGFEAAKQVTELELKKARLFSDGRKALAAKQYAKAVKALSDAIELSPMENWIWYWRGDAYAGLAQWHKAIANYTKVIEMFKTTNMVPYYAYLSRGLARLGSGDAANGKADLAVALPVMIKSLRHTDGATSFDYADNPTAVREALAKLTPEQRRENMILRLRRATGQDFGYKAGKEPGQIEVVIGKWEAWWKQNASGYKSPGTAATCPAS